MKTVREMVAEVMERTERIETALLGGLDGTSGLIDRVRGVEAFVTQQRKVKSGARSRVREIFIGLVIGVLLFIANDAYERMTHSACAAAIEAATEASR